MSTKTSNFALSPIHPPLGTLIDGGSLQLVEVLGVGGYGVVFRAVETRPLTRNPKSYAVKCLITTASQNPRSRQVQIREIALHQLASRHPGVVTLHRVVEHLNHTYIIMDYAPDHDLFTQILHNCRYLGDDALIRDVFLQLLDAVEYCHSLGIYHRDLKPENILCYDDGLRVAITDFGLATTDKLSDEFRTGSVFHMSPECQGAPFAPHGNYSPMHNDIWSLGIILLNLATGRNPWKSATADDPTFQAYLRKPSAFLPSVLPISDEVNRILVGMLEVDYRRRTPLREVRKAIQEARTFYSDGVIFEGSMARCPWESGMDIDVASSDEPDEPLPRSPSPQPEPPVSRWSKESDIVFARQPILESPYDESPWTNRSSCGATWAYESTLSSSTTTSDSENVLRNSSIFDQSRTPSEASLQSPMSSPPATPNSAEIAFGSKVALGNRKPLTINTNVYQPRFYNPNYNPNTDNNSFSEDSALMQTAIEFDPRTSTYYLTSAISESKVIALPPSAITAVAEDKEMMSPSMWQPSTEITSPSLYSNPSSNTSSSSYQPSHEPIPRLQRTGRFIETSESIFLRSNTPSPESVWSSLHIQRHQRQQLMEPRNPSEQSQHLSPIFDSFAMTDILPPSPALQSTERPFPPVFSPPSRPLPANKKEPIEKGKRQTSNLFSLRLFPRSPSPTPAQQQRAQIYAQTKPKVSPYTGAASRNSDAGGANIQDAAGISTGLALGRFHFEQPAEQTLASTHEDRHTAGGLARCSFRTHGSLVARHKKIFKAIDHPTTEASCTRNHEHEWGTSWFRESSGGSEGSAEGSVEGARGNIALQLDLFQGQKSGITTDNNESEKTNAGTREQSSFSSRQSRFSVGRKSRRAQRSRSPRHWFIPGRFFASAGAAA